MESELFTLVFRQRELCADDITEEYFIDYTFRRGLYDCDYLSEMRHVLVQCMAKFPNGYWSMSWVIRAIPNVVIDFVLDCGKSFSNLSNYDHEIVKKCDVDLMKKFLKICPECKDEWESHVGDALLMDEKIFDVLTGAFEIPPEKIIEYINNLEIGSFGDEDIPVKSFVKKYNKAIKYLETINNLSHDRGVDGKSNSSNNS